MEDTRHEIEGFKPFSESLIWQLNRDFYQQRGIEAWSSGLVPHHVTSNSMTGKTYAELILGFLKDLAAKGKTKETVYIVELGAGHGRMAFHILKHLERLKKLLDIELPPFCYVLSDIVEKNLQFFKEHPQLQTYYEQGVLDLAYFDAIGSKEIVLQYSGKTIKAKTLDQPIIAIANYFFDSLPNDLFFVKDENIDACSIALSCVEDPKDMDVETLLKSLNFSYENTRVEEPVYKDKVLNEILEDYKKSISDSYLYFPEKGLQCLKNLNEISNKGLLVLSMDKGFNELRDIENVKSPDIVTHGSMSIWVNFHAISAFCEKHGGKVVFPTFSTFHFQVACIFFLPESDSYQYTHAAYQRFVNDFGPDDFNTIKKMAYYNISKVSFIELIAMIRLSAYDSSVFSKVLHRLKQLSNSITFNQRGRLAQSLHQVWNYYFNINEKIDLAYELGGFFYDLGFYEEALVYFKYSTLEYGEKDDIYYNRILCHYQMRNDELFADTLSEAKLAFPASTMFAKLDGLDLTAV